MMESFKKNPILEKSQEKKREKKILFADSFQ